MAKQIKNTILILGAKSEMAKATAEEYAKNGYNLILAGRSVENNLKDFHYGIKENYNTHVSLLEFDILDFDSHKQFFESLEDTPNGVICFIGLLGVQITSEIDFDHAKQIIDSNFTGIVSILNIFAKYFEERKDGFIIAVASVAGEKGRKSNYTYGASKSALITYLSGLRNRLYINNVNVMTIIPGYVKTKMIKDIDTPSLLTSTPEAIGKIIYKNHKKGKDIVYAPRYWRYIMWILSIIPERIFKKLSV